MSFASALAAQLAPTRRWPTPGAMAQALAPNTVQTPALDLIDRELVDVADGKTVRLMVFTPPQVGKSTRISRRFPAWLLSQDPTLRIVLVSYELEKAVRWGRDIKLDVQMHPELGIELRPDSKAAGRWHTRQGGGIYCVGIGGALTGQPADYLLVDDPVKDRQAAESLTKRQHAWDWWENVGQTRLSPRGRTVLVQTRWHKDDLAGRLLENEGDRWRVVSLPAIAESPHDPLGRPVGTELAGGQPRPPGYYAELRERLSAYVWRSLYQQRPTDPTGSIFLRDRWRYWTWLDWPNYLDLGGVTLDLRDTWRFITADLAASTRTSADWTVAAAWALTLNRDLVCLGRVRARTAQENHWDLIRPLATEWRTADVGVESTMMGTTLVRSAVRGGLSPFDLHADKDKITRAIPASHMQREGRIWLPQSADWIDEWVSEFSDFPSAAHDDQVDVLAYAVRQVIGGWHPGGSPATPPDCRPDPFEAQLTSAFGAQESGLGYI